MLRKIQSTDGKTFKNIVNFSLMMISTSLNLIQAGASRYHKLYIFSIYLPRFPLFAEFGLGFISVAQL